MTKRKKLNIYLVNVTILEGRHYAWSNINSFVRIKVDNKKATTKLRKGTDCPYYNEYFVFEFVTTLQKLLDMYINLTVVKRTACRRKILGFLTIDCATVWDQRDRQFYRKWAILSSPSGDFAGPRGYLKVTISILAKGEAPKIPMTDPKNDDEIEGNLLLPEGISTERHRSLFIFNIYKGIGIMQKTSKPLPKPDEKLSIQRKMELPRSYVRISFAGLTGKTKKKKYTYSPAWNQSISICELFPPLCQRVKIQLCYRFDYHCYVKTVKYLKMSSIASDKEYGFLPTFGPAFVHFYRHGEFGMEYVGKVLMSLETKLNSDAGMRKVTRSSIPTILESGIWTYEDIFAFVAIFDVSVINKMYKSHDISFEIVWGAKKQYKSVPKPTEEETEDDPNINLFTTKKYKPVTANRVFWNLDFKNRFPCMYITSLLPNLRRRLYNSNLIGNIVSNMKQGMDQIDYLLENNVYSSNNSMIGMKITQLLDYVSSACRHFIDVVLPSSNYITNLDTEKKKYILREMAIVEELCSKIYDKTSISKSYARCKKLYKRLELLIDHPQECWPDLILWLKTGNSRTASIKLEARDMVYSANSGECGKYCGHVNTLHFQRKKSQSKSDIVCKIDIYLWMGPKAFEDQCYKSLPMRCDLMAENGMLTYLTFQNHTLFLARIHIYQGRFLIASDYTGLSDLFVRVVINDQYLKTRTKRTTLNPIWDEMLLFQNVRAYGTHDQIMSKAPVVTLEILDQDKCFQVEYVGYSELDPVIKFDDMPYAPPNFPPKLSWYQVRNEDIVVGEILAAAEYLEMTSDYEKLEPRLVYPIPMDIKPTMRSYRLEVFFWGMRDLKRNLACPVNKPRILIECNEETLASTTIADASKDSNFIEPEKYLDTTLPDSIEFIPPLTINLYDCRCFCRCMYLGTNLTYIQKFMYNPLTKREWERRVKGLDDDVRLSMGYNVNDDDSFELRIEGRRKNQTYLKKAIDAEKKKKKFNLIRYIAWCINCFKCLKIYRQKKKAKQRKKKRQMEEELNLLDDDIDWWTKYYTSIEGATTNEKLKNFKVKIYDEELEKQPEFEKLADMLKRIKLYRGKTTGDEIDDEKLTVGILKCQIKIYVWPPMDGVHFVTPIGHSLHNGYFQSYPSNTLESFVVRVYCIRGIKLRPKERAGLCDPFIRIELNEMVIDDVKNYIPKTVNPIFGRCYELEGSFPQNNKIRVAVYDWDKSSKRDFIGETFIDLENRYYTRHRAHCGLQYEYSVTGPCPWRDHHKPTEILEQLCIKNNLPPPEYTDTAVRICNKIFLGPAKELKEADPLIKSEMIALSALHRWKEIPVVGCALVPEHVETRSLYDPAQLGIEQGKLQLWLDIFPCGDAPAPDKVNIVPRNPIKYELRVIIWNTDEVILDEDDFFGDRKSDIYVKGWLGSTECTQQTDVHYRSMTGEGNFNWRFVFPFEYSTTEHKIVLKKKDTVFDVDYTERRVPSKIYLQVWDNDIFSPDDFLGSLTMELSQVPRGAKSQKKCSIKMLREDAPTVNLFKVKRTRGWWPFTAAAKEQIKPQLTGKLDAEFVLLTGEEAAAAPVGLGRSEPEPLPPPKRPETSFNWIFNPFKTCKYIIWKNLKYKLLKLAICLALLMFIAAAVYSLPGYTVKKLIGA